MKVLKRKIEFFAAIHPGTLKVHLLFGPPSLHPLGALDAIHWIVEG
jgi:hypothetical protein